jgi:hypothetical protein
VVHPDFPGEFGGVGEVHAAFFNESRTRGRVRRSAQEILVRGRKQKSFIMVAGRK